MDVPIPQVSRSLLAVVSLAALIALAGCSMPAASASHSASPTTTRTSTPTAAALTAPRAALPLTCAQLLPLEKVQSHLTDDVSIKIDESHLPGVIGDLAVLQAGGTECAWGGVNRTDASYDTGVTLAILPDGIDGFTALATNPQTTWSTKNTIGQMSGYNCSPTSDTGGDWCSGDAVISGYWVSFTVNDVNGAQSDASVVGVMKDVATAISAAGAARSNWTPPATTVSGTRWCSDPGAAAMISSAVGTPMTLTTPNSANAQFGILPVASAREGAMSCGWTGADGHGVTLETLPAGAWALPSITANPPVWVLLGTPTALTVTGSDGAVFACGDGCQAMVARGGSLLVAYEFSNTDVSSEFPATVQKLVDGAAA